MNSKINKHYLIKKNLKLILNTMLPGNNYMPYFTKAVKIENIILKKNRNKFLQFLEKKINLNEKKSWDLLRNVRKENITSLLKKVNLKKKYYR